MCGFITPNTPANIVRIPAGPQTSKREPQQDEMFLGHDGDEFVRPQPMTPQEHICLWIYCHNNKGCVTLQSHTFVFRCAHVIQGSSFLKGYLYLFYTPMFTLLGEYFCICEKVVCVLQRKLHPIFKGLQGLFLEPTPAVSGQGNPGQVTSSLQGPQEQFGAQYLAQGHFDMQLSSAQRWDLNYRLFDH